MGSRTRYLSVLGLATAVAIMLAAGTAIGTPGSGAVGTVVARGSAEEKVMTRGNQPYDVVVQSVTIAAGGHTGWHTHPGMATAVVTSGTLTIYHANDRTCTPHPFGPGHVYVDPGYGHVHIGRNEGTTTVELMVTYLDVPIGGAFRIDAPNPGNCAF